jgi:hypothetical protein
LLILYEVPVDARGRRHEPYSKYASIFGIAKSFDLPTLASVFALEPTPKTCFYKRIPGAGPRHICRYLHKVVRIYGTVRLLKCNVREPGTAACSQQNRRTQQTYYRRRNRSTISSLIQLFPAKFPANMSKCFSGKTCGNCCTAPGKRQNQEQWTGFSYPAFFRFSRQ